ncbi:Tetratricopeptide repeat protein [Streptomyces sp. ADI95-17]|nr:Tetratricopeptide repeat protein [Streptomyces sp. ADI95-17]
MGADIHVFADGNPLYVLESWRPPPPTDQRWLREMPSRMLNARFAVVDFTGRQQELADLRRWCLAGSRLAVRWLYGPGGQGKTRLADQFAQAACADGWKVVTATHGLGTVLPPPGSQDLRLDGAVGMLLIIDYADRWPLSHLAWLLSNSLLHQSTVPTRVLMLARSADGWPAVRGSVANLQASTSTQLLEPLPAESDGGPGQRTEMFKVARASFAIRFGAAAEQIMMPGPLDHPDFGLPLAVHLAALVAVDAYITGQRPPTSMADLTLYLLDREHTHWVNLYGDGLRKLTASERSFRTPPSVMNQAVFAAALTGSQPPDAGRFVLGHLPRQQLPAEQIVADHTRCYPPAFPGRATVLEPLYPDRLAEDFLALTLPGHHADYPSQPWSASVAGKLLGRGSDGAPPGWAPRAITFLASAAERWPHLGPEHLYPLLREDPHLAIDAGSAVMIALAHLGDVPPDLLDSIASHFPDAGKSDLDTGIAHITARRAQYKLPVTDSVFTRASILFDLGVRLWRAGLYEQALEASEEGVRLSRGLAETDPSMIPAAASSLLNLSVDYSMAGRREEALAAVMESVSLYRRLADDDPVRHSEAFAHALDSLSGVLGSVGRIEESLAASAESLTILYGMSSNDPLTHGSTLARVLQNYSSHLRNAGRMEQALTIVQQALEIRRTLAATDPAVHEVDFAYSLSASGSILKKLGRYDEALAAYEESIHLGRRLAVLNPEARVPELAVSLGGLSGCLYVVGLHQDAVTVLEEAIHLHRKLATSNPAANEPELARSLGSLGLLFSEPDVERFREALNITQEALGIFHRLSTEFPSAFMGDMADSLVQFAVTRKNVRMDLINGLSAAKEAVRIYGRLGQEIPEAYSQKQAVAYLAIVDILQELGFAKEASKLRGELGQTP